MPKLADLYERSPQYAKLSDSSKRLYDIYLRKLERLMPSAPVSEITRGDMRKLFDGMSEKPGAANAFLSAASAMFAWGVEREYLSTNPCEGIKKHEDGEHEPWPDHVLRAALVAEDTDVRRIAHVLYYTGQRLNDGLRVAWSDDDGTYIKVRQKKTGKVLAIRVHSALRRELDSRSRTGLLICADANGHPIKDAAARYKLQKFAAKFGVKVVPHGLRKNAVIALLEAGCSVAETAAISGQSLRMAEYYARQRDQRKLGDVAMLRWENAQ